MSEENGLVFVPTDFRLSGFECEGLGALLPSTAR
jgi:hypothetical protein